MTKRKAPDAFSKIRAMERIVSAAAKRDAARIVDASRAQVITPIQPMTPAAQLPRTSVEAIEGYAGVFIRDALTIDERHALGINADGNTFALTLKVLKDEATRRLMMARATALSRVPLIGERYQATLARGLELPLLKFASGAWASVSKPVIDTAYMTGGVPALTLTDQHPGSRAGLFVVDLRDRSHFQDARGNTTPESILARVAGRAVPK
jgi:hypothetical protein